MGIENTGVVVSKRPSVMTGSEEDLDMTPLDRSITIIMVSVVRTGFQSKIVVMM
jgi:hypothetical protein